MVIAKAPRNARRLNINLYAEDETHLQLLTEKLHLRRQADAIRFALYYAARAMADGENAPPLKPRYLEEKQHATKPT